MLGALAFVAVLAVLAVLARASPSHTGPGRDPGGQEPRSFLIPTAEASRRNPLTGAEAWQQGTDLFRNHCAQCHGADGRGATAIGPRMYPPVPDLASPEIQRFSDGALFAVVSHGVSWTGMPAFGRSLGESDRWKLVAFVRRTPSLTAADLAPRDAPNASTRIVMDGTSFHPAEATVDSGAVVLGPTSIRSSQRDLRVRKLSLGRPRAGWHVGLPADRTRDVRISLHAASRHESRPARALSFSLSQGANMRRATTFFIVTALMLPVAALSARAVNDAKIAAIVVTANQVDIDAGKLAGSSASDPKVKAFGNQMVTDHTGVNKQATDLVTKLGVTPEDNATAQSLKSGGAENVKNLSGLKGAAFDRAYVEHEVAYHQQVLDALDKTLIPGRAECRAQGAAGEGPAGVRGPSRAREDGAEVVEVTSMSPRVDYHARIKFAMLTVTYSGLFYDGPALTVVEQIRKARQLGFDGLSIETKRPVASPLDLTAADPKEIRSVAASEGIALCALESLSNFASPLMEERENNLAMMRLAIERPLDPEIGLVKGVRGVAGHHRR